MKPQRGEPAAEFPGATVGGLGGSPFPIPRGRGEGGVKEMAGTEPAAGLGRVPSEKARGLFSRPLLCLLNGCSVLQETSRSRSPQLKSPAGLCQRSSTLSARAALLKPIQVIRDPPWRTGAIHNQLISSSTVGGEGGCGVSGSPLPTRLIRGGPCPWI